jgi:hypothetical protein
MAISHLLFPLVVQFHKTHNRCGSAARPAANFNLLTGLTAAFAGCEAQSAEQLLYSF